MLHAKTARGKCTTSDKSPFKLIFRDSVGKRKRKETKQANKQTNKTLINKYPRGGDSHMKVAGMLVGNFELYP